MIRVAWVAPVMFVLGFLVRGTNITTWVMSVFDNNPPIFSPDTTQSHDGTVDLGSTTIIEQRLVNPTQTSQSAVLMTPSQISTEEILLAHLSYYWPPFGEINCDYECEHLANGDGWKKWVGKGVACPPQYPLGTIFIIMGDEWTCIDRGEAIVVNTDGSLWLDLLSPIMPYDIAWGSTYFIEVRPPSE